jgi:pimeloyl-ACP methyl ester carboxylesterase
VILVKDSVIETRSGKVGYSDTGEGRIALFVHGAGTNGYLWRNVIAHLEQERRCIAIDLPAHGRTPSRPDLSLGAMADVVEDFCAAVDLRDIDLVAHDTGGAVAQIFAARHPERLRTFTLTNCETHDDVPPESFKPTVDLAKQGALAPGAGALLADLDLAREATGFNAMYERPVSDETIRAYLEPIFGTPQAAREFERFLAALEPTDLLAVEPELRKLEIPTLVVWGTGDTTFDISRAHWLRDTIPGVTEIVEIDGARLFFPDERAGELVLHLRRHWGTFSVQAA